MTKRSQMGWWVDETQPSSFRSLEFACVRLRLRWLMDLEPRARVVSVCFWTKDPKPNVSWFAHTTPALPIHHSQPSTLRATMPAPVLLPHAVFWALRHARRASSSSVGEESGQSAGDRGPHSGSTLPRTLLPLCAAPRTAVSAKDRCCFALGAARRDRLRRVSSSLLGDMLDDVQSLDTAA